MAPYTQLTMYYSNLFEYLSSTKAVVDMLTFKIEEFVAKELDEFEGKKSVPLFIFIALTLFIPVVIYITLHTTTSMLNYSEIYNERVTNYKEEKKKTEQLLTALLPRSIIHQLKKGQARENGSELASLHLNSKFLGSDATNIPFCFHSALRHCWVHTTCCGLNCPPGMLPNMLMISYKIETFWRKTQINGLNIKTFSSHSKRQIVELLNELYNEFDNCLVNFEVYKVETIGDAYLIAAGVPECNTDHALEICRQVKVASLKVPHRARK